MATPTGQISYTDVKNELKVSGEIRLSHSNVRELAKKPSGQIAFSDLRGKSLGYGMIVGTGGVDDWGWSYRVGYGSCDRTSIDGTGHKLNGVYVYPPFSGNSTNIRIELDGKAFYTNNVELIIEGCGTYYLSWVGNYGAYNVKSDRTMLNFLAARHGQRVQFKVRFY